MANPIIKIKRGNIAPTSPGGITAAEFAFDVSTNTLYIGISGGGFKTDGSGGNNSSTNPNAIPIGMQIAKSSEFNTSPTNTPLGYADTSVPTTKAVKDWVSFVKNVAVSGYTLYAGEGISLGYFDPSNIDQGLTIYNTGVIKGFTSFGITGNFAGNFRVYAANSVDGLTLNAASGIQISGDNTNRTLTLLNIGVTGINGVTGNITSITPIASLSGYTGSVVGLINTYVSALSPLYATSVTTETELYPTIKIGHNLSAVTPAAYKGLISNIPQIYDITVDNRGHIQAISQENISFANALNWPNFVEAVQDAAYPGITYIGSKPYGIDFIYNDAQGILQVYNRGITSIAVNGQGPGMSGAVVLSAGNDISLTQNNGTNQIAIAYTGSQFKTVTPGLGSNYESGEIYADGKVSGTSVVADDRTDTLNLLAGRGIGISAGDSANLETVLIWNTGVNLINAYDSSDTLLGGAGLSGPVSIKPGSNIEIQRGTGANLNTITIKSTAAGGGGTITDIQADYTNNTYDSSYTGSGVTGTVNVSGTTYGVFTTQTSGSLTKNGTVEIGLGSIIKLPSSIFPVSGPTNRPLTEGGGVPGTALSEIIIPETRSTVGTSSINLPDKSYSFIYNYNKLTTDAIEGGLTAAFSYGSNAPVFNAGTWNLDNSKAGKILILTARPGSLDRITGNGSDPSTQYQQAEIRLLAWPNPENLGFELAQAFDPSNRNNGYGGCPGNDCVGYPPETPRCVVVDSGTGIGENDYNTGTANTSSIAMHGNILAKKSVYVDDDIWIKGNIIDAKSGCLYAANSTGGISTPGGKLGLTGDLVVGGSIYVHGGTAFFNVDNLSTESQFIFMGGLSASDGYSNEYTTDTSNASDVGLLLSTHNTRPYTPPNGVAQSSPGGGTQQSSPSTKKAFVGIDSDDFGVFKYIDDATVTVTGTGVGANRQIAYGTNARLGPAKFGTVNGVGITADTSGNIILRYGRSPVPGTPASDVLPTDIRMLGYLSIIGGGTNLATKGVMTLNSSANVGFGTGSAFSTTDNSIFEINNGSAVRFMRGVTFDVGSGTYTSEAENTAASPTNNFKIVWQQTSASGANRTLNIRNFGDGTRTTAVDVGRYYTGFDPTTATSLATLPNGTLPGSVSEAPLQVLYNKQLAEGTIIDCGTY